MSVLLLGFGANPIDSFLAMFQGALGDQSKSLSVVAFWIPPILTATGLLVTFTAGLWNIGVEGQIIMGAIAASWVALKFTAPSIKEIQPHLIAVLDAVLALVASAHAILNKRDTRSAVGWIGLIWLVPLLGSLLYALLGINRIKRRARALRSDRGQ